MPLVGFEPTISAGEWPQTYASDRAATGTGLRGLIPDNINPLTLIGYFMYHQVLNKILDILGLMPTPCIYVFCTDLRAKSNYFIQ